MYLRKSYLKIKPIIYNKRKNKQRIKISVPAFKILKLVNILVI